MIYRPSPASDPTEYVGECVDLFAAWGWACEESAKTGESWIVWEDDPEDTNPERQWRCVAQTAGFCPVALLAQPDPKDAEMVSLSRAFIAADTVHRHALGEGRGRASREQSRAYARLYNAIATHGGALRMLARLLANERVAPHELRGPNDV